VEVDIVDGVGDSLECVSKSWRMRNPSLEFTCSSDGSAGIDNAGWLKYCFIIVNSHLDQLKYLLSARYIFDHRSIGSLQTI